MIINMQRFTMIALIFNTHILLYNGLTYRLQKPMYYTTPTETYNDNINSNRHDEFIYYT